MIALFIILGVLIPYLVQGARYARKRYAEVEYNNSLLKPKLNDSVTRKQALSDMKGERASLVLKKYGNYYNHTYNCRALRWNSDTYQNAHCNCGSVKRAAELAFNIRKIENGQSLDFVLPNNPVLMPMMLWPGYVLNDYLKGGTVERANPLIIAELERENGLDSLE